MTITGYIKIGIAVIIFFSGFTSAWWIQNKRMTSTKADLSSCTVANAENEATITALKAEIEKGNKTCEQRLNSKDAVIKRLKDIDNLTSKPKTTGGAHEKTHADTGNPLRDALNGMWIQ